MSRPGLPICLVSGFLGAGKTTLLNHILSNRRGLRAMVFVNEFGAIDIDGRLVRWRGAVDEAQIVTLDNGCICCEVNADLAKQLHKVLRQYAGQLDFIVIETSGVCDPGPVLATLEQFDDVALATHLDSVVALVDATAWDEEAAAPPAQLLGLEETARAQVAHSDVVLLNKCDLLGGLDSERAVRAEARFSRHMEQTVAGFSRPVPRVLRTEHAAVDLALITALPAGEGADTRGTAEPQEKRSRTARAEAAETEEAGIVASPGSVPPPPPAPVPALKLQYARGGSALRSRVHSFVYEADRPFDALKFESWLDAGGPPRSVCRAKGLLWLRGIPQPVVFQLAGGRTNPFETLGGSEAPKGSTLVFIGEAGALRQGDEASVIAALDACLC